jgi:hypothetical protein
LVDTPSNEAVSEDVEIELLLLLLRRALIPAPVDVATNEIEFDREVRDGFCSDEDDPEAIAASEGTSLPPNEEMDAVEEIEDDRDPREGANENTFCSETTGAYEVCTDADGIRGKIAGLRLLLELVPLSSFSATTASPPTSLLLLLLLAVLSTLKVFCLARIGRSRLATVEGPPECESLGRMPCIIGTVDDGASSFLLRFRNKSTAEDVFGLSNPLCGSRVTSSSVRSVSSWFWFEIRPRWTLLVDDDEAAADVVEEEEDDDGRFFELDDAGGFSSSECDSAAETSSSSSPDGIGRGENPSSTPVFAPFFLSNANNGPLSPT